MTIGLDSLFYNVLFHNESCLVWQKSGCKGTWLVSINTAWKETLGRTI